MLLDACGKKVAVPYLPAFMANAQTSSLQEGWEAHRSGHRCTPGRRTCLLRFGLQQRPACGRGNHKATYALARHLSFMTATLAQAACYQEAWHAAPTTPPTTGWFGSLGKRAWRRAALRYKVLHTPCLTRKTYRLMVDLTRRRLTAATIRRLAASPRSTHSGGGILHLRLHHLPAAIRHL